MQLSIRALRARPTAGPVNQVLWEAKQVWQTCSFYMYSYITVRIIPTVLIPDTSLWASTTRTTAVRVYNSINMTLCTEGFTCCFSGTTKAVTNAVAAVVVLTLTHSLQCSPWLQDRLQWLCGVKYYLRRKTNKIEENNHNNRNKSYTLDKNEKARSAYACIRYIPGIIR